MGAGEHSPTSHPTYTTGKQDLLWFTSPETLIPAPITHVDPKEMWLHGWRPLVPQGASHGRVGPSVANWLWVCWLPLL